MITVLLLILSFFIVFTIFGFAISGPRYKGPVSDHFNGKTFINPGHRKAHGIIGVLKWALNRDRGQWPVIKNNGPGERPPGSVHAGVRITFVNHSTFLIQFDGINILTDPVWSERASPFSWAGPKRMRAPGIRFEDLPKIHGILLSHNHYDHLDVETLKKLSDIYRPKIFTALGVKALLGQENILNAVDMDWWEERSIQDSITVQAVPAQHFSARGIFDRDATLWCGFVIKRHDGNIYFAGDTGYNEETFKEIGKRCKPLSISLIPIGAYKPLWFMSPVHCSPEDAVKIHQDTRSHVSIATHFGTFPLGDDGYDDPMKDLRKALKSNGIAESEFLVLEEGIGKVIYSA